MTWHVLTIPNCIPNPPHEAGSRSLHKWIYGRIPRECKRCGIQIIIKQKVNK